MMEGTERLLSYNWHMRVSLNKLAQFVRTLGTLGVKATPIPCSLEDALRRLEDNGT